MEHYSVTKPDLHTLAYEFIDQHFGQPLKHSDHGEPLRQLLELAYRLGVADEREANDDI